MPKHKAVPFNPPNDAQGRPLVAEEGCCLWCGEYVTSQREEAGCTLPDDPAWATETGDYGCDCSPQSSEDGCGDHARPYDLALRLIKEIQKES